MLLSKTDMPLPLVKGLAKFNIQFVEQFISIGNSRTFLEKISIALAISVQDLEKWVFDLTKKYPDLEIPPARGRRYPTGYRVNSAKLSSSKTHT